MQVRRTRGFIAATGALLGVLALPFFLESTGSAQPPQGGAPPPPPEVAVLEIQTEKITLTTELPGRTSAYLVAEVRPQVSGIIQSRKFTEGSLVEEGEVLYEIEPAPYKAAHDLAVAAQARAEANVPPIELMAERQKDLVPTGAVSHQDYDEVIARLKQAKAEIEYSKAAVESARINLDFTQVKAPITGRIGRSNVTVGALATAHQGPPFATIQQLDPIYVDVTQSTSQLQRLQNRLKSGQLSRDEVTADKVQLVLEDGTVYPSEGKLQFRDVTVDPTTGSVILRVLFPNPDEYLLPGMFVRAVVTEGIKDQAILVPQQAVMRNPRGNPLVMLVTDEHKVEQRMLTLDRTVGDRWLVAEGLTPGERVIVEGLQRIRPGADVTVVPWEAGNVQQPADSSGAPAAPEDAAGAPEKDTSKPVPKAN
ncbi:MAG: efflux RND transporter periplasmic adaptor subunit [Candidatus Hydrogenedentes bacterium]|nr:efflux RND transporter periplasmic adaptor subunit [Candidatus Hydrogenedentota bacterium]